MCEGISEGGRERDWPHAPSLSAVGKGEGGRDRDWPHAPNLSAVGMREEEERGTSHTHPVSVQ